MQKTSKCLLEEEATSFKKIKRLLCTETVLAHYDPSLPLGLSCDASECGIGAVLFHRFADESERPILNISKILSATQRRYSQIQSRQSSKHSNAEDSEVVSKVEHHYTLGDPCYALYFGPRRDRDPRWVPAIVTKVHGARSVNVRVIPRGPTWRRHLDQL